MKQFFKPSLWKIILTILFLIIACYLWLIYDFSHLSLCGLLLPGYKLKLPPFTFSGFVQQIPNAITDNYIHCPEYLSASLQAAIILVDGSYFLIALLLSYMLACGLVALVNKIKNRKIKKV